MASHPEPPNPKRKPAGQKMPLRSTKLDRTLHDLESALSEWTSLGTRTAATSAPTKEAKAAPSDEDFRKKTKKLLAALREQLAELEDK